MKLRPFRAAIALTTALTTAAAPLLAGAQTSYELKSYKPGLVVSGSTSAPEAPAPGTPPPVTPQPALTLSTTAINFGDVATNTTETRQVLVSNPGTGSFTFTAAPAVTGAAEFAAGLTTCGTTLAAGADCLAEATFSPTLTGTFNGILTLTSVLASSPHEVSLVGTAFNPVSLASTTLPQGMVGKAYSYDFKQLLNVSNETSPDKSQVTWEGSGTLPAGLSFNTSTGVLSGTPAAITPETSYTVTGTYKNNQGQQVYTIKVGEAVLEVVQIAAGFLHTCALTTAGGVKCWGTNGNGELGNRSTVKSAVPVTVSGLASGVASIGAQANHTCALTTAGGVKCWGANGNGQLGDGTTTSRQAPVEVLGLAGSVASIAVGGYHTCARTTAGAVKCWGYNGTGQLGDGTKISRPSPVTVNVLPAGVASVVAGGRHTCAVTVAGAAVCWGWNGYGQLGDGTKTDQAVPVLVTGLGSGVASLTLSDINTCAVTTAGALKCWGDNTYGQLGDGTKASQTAPVSVVGLGSSVANVALGATHTCAVTTGGAAKCWGNGGHGQLGDGTATSSTTPVVVSGLDSGVTWVTAGGYHSCAVTSTGAAKCWGNNPEGQLGDGTTTKRNTPINVLP